MSATADWRAELRQIVELMRELSKQTDPQAAGKLYSDGLRQGLVPADAWLTVSRRELEPPRYRISRSSRWKQEINPWKQRDKLPVFDRGLLGELIYSEEPAVLENLPAHVRPDDPAREYLEGFELLVTMPNYDNGLALNMGVLLIHDAATFPFERIPIFVWQSNLFGRGTLNLLLRQQLAEAYAALDRELRTVGEMQRSLLPQSLPQIPRLRLAADYQTAARAGGDYYDLFPLPDECWGLFVADVSGHGTPAAVMMAITHAIAHEHPGPATPPSAVLARLNRVLHRRYTNGTPTFVTACYAVFNPRAGTLCYAAAGHPPGRLVRRGQVTPLDAVGGLPLGITGEAEYAETKVTLESGDVLALLTDGIIEAHCPGGGMFGEARLDRVLAEAAAQDDPQRIVGAIAAAVEDFCAARPMSDDRTLLVARFD